MAGWPWRQDQGVLGALVTVATHAGHNHVSFALCCRKSVRLLGVLTGKRIDKADLSSMAIQALPDLI
jgi:hypothetical protein